VKTPRNLGDLQKKAKHLQDSTKRVAVGMMVKNLKEGTIKIVRTNHGTKEKIGLTKTIVRKEDLVGKKVEPEGITGKIQVEVVDLIEMIIEHMENEEGDLVMTIRVDDLAEIQNLEAVDSTEKMEEVDSTEKMEEVDLTEKMEEVDSTEKMEEVDLIRLTMTNLGEKEMTIQLIGEVLKTKMMVEVGKIETVLAVTKVVTVGKIGKIERVVVEAGIKIETVGKMAAVIGKADLIMMVVSRKVVLAESHQRKEAVSGNLGRKVVVIHSLSIPLNHKRKICYMMDKIRNNSQPVQCCYLAENGTTTWSKCSHVLPDSVGGIPPVTVKVGSSEDIQVVFTTSPMEFYVQLTSSFDELNELMEKIKTACESGEVSDMSSVAEKVGCLAKYSEDDSWYRGYVEEKSFDTAKVLFVDYGNKEDVSCDKIKELPESMCVLPVQAVKCRLYAVPETAETDAFSALVDGKTLNAQFVAKHFLTKSFQLRHVTICDIVKS
ncbi:hypothetical protein J6590_096475, partial [Homalodisca vitripennis]